MGPKEWADWYQGCVRAVREQHILGEPEILVLSNAQYAGGIHEADQYKETLQRLGATNIRVIRECTETVTQIEYAVWLAREEGKQLVVVSTWLHYLRVAWLLRGTEARHLAAFGIPHWRYAIADLILTFAFPFIDLIPGGRERFVRHAEKKRDQGKFL